jgi:hypothetical protein
MKLKPEIKARWFELADEMVGYKCTGQLRRTDTRDKQEVVCYCFLGLLGLAVQEVLGVGRLGLFSFHSISGGTASRPPDMLEMVACDNPTERDAQELADKIMEMNDRFQISFPKIREQIKDMV